jgi:hypothetical protein
VEAGSSIVWLRTGVKSQIEYIWLRQRGVVFFFAGRFDFRLCFDEEEGIQPQCCPFNSEPGNWFTIPDNNEEMTK